MLIEFNVKNFRSFWETQVLKMTAGPTKDLLEKNSFEAPLKGLPRLLRSAVMYGPNGAGKSNLIAALDFMQQFVLTSSKERQEGDPIDRKPFLLHSDGSSMASELEIFFIHHGIRYQYGFACTETRVIHEWLLTYPGNRAQRWFERSFNPETNEEDWYFGSKFTGSKKTWQDNTRSNALFLSTAVQLNSEQLQPVFAWFKELVIIRHGQRIDPSFTATSCQEKETKKSILKFMKDADINIDGIDIEEKHISAEELDLPADMSIDMQNIIKKNLDGQTFRRVKLNHHMSDSDKSISFPLEEESDGTQKLFAYAAPWLDVLNSGRVLVIDELDNSFHPHMVRFLLNLIHSSDSNKSNGQLIFSTHDTSILDQKILRRDQVWFLEKNRGNASELYSLADFRPRKGEALERGYLQGRYGALPYIGEVKF